MSESEMQRLHNDVAQLLRAIDAEAGHEGWGFGSLAHHQDRRRLHDAANEVALRVGYAQGESESTDALSTKQER